MMHIRETGPVYSIQDLEKHTITGYIVFCTWTMTSTELAFSMDQRLPPPHVENVTPMALAPETDITL